MIKEIEALRSMEACEEALDWLQSQPSWKVAWATCERGDWMIWLPAMLSGPPESASRKKLVLTTCACARLALPYVRRREKRPRITIETAEGWARGEKDITLKKVNAAASAASVICAAYAACATAATYAAAHATYAASAAAYTAYAAAHATYAAYAAYAASAACAAYATYAAYAATYNAILKQCADIVRQFYPDPPELAEIRRTG